MPRAKKPKYSYPENYRKIMKRGDFEEIKSVFQDPEMLKYFVESKESRYNPLFDYTPCTKIYKWFVEQGFDLNMTDSYDQQPIHSHIHDQDSNIEGIILAGADIEAKYQDRHTPLQYAALHLRPRCLEALIKHGADVNAKMKNTYPDSSYKMSDEECEKKYPGKGILALLLNNFDDVEAVITVECLEILINAGAEIEDGLKERVIEICTENYATKGSIGKALTRMCKLFGVKRPKSIVHDGTSPIAVTATDWREQHAELWKMLVPPQGKCKTVQGETVRICGKINDEIFNQGGAHWDAEFRKMLNALKKYYEMGTIPDEAEYKEALGLIKTIGKNSDGEDVLRLCEINIHWVLANPEPIELGEVNYKR